MGRDFTYCWPSKRSVVTILLPGLVEALDKLLEEGMRLVENGESQDVDSVVQQAVQALEGKLLEQPKQKMGLEGKRGTESFKATQCPEGNGSCEILDVEAMQMLEGRSPRFHQGLTQGAAHLSLLMNTPPKSSALLAKFHKKTPKPSKEHHSPAG